MGMAAGQARLLSITSRLSDNELRAQIINNNKMRLAAESSQVSENYVTALNQAQYMVANYDADNNASYKKMTFNALTSYNPYNNQYALVNSSGQILVSETDAVNFSNNSDDLDGFLKCYGLERSTTYFDKLENQFGKNGIVTFTNFETGDKDQPTDLTAKQLEALYFGTKDSDMIESITSAIVGWDKTELTNGSIPSYDDVQSGTAMNTYLTALNHYLAAEEAYHEAILPAMQKKLDDLISNYSSFSDANSYNELINKVSGETNTSNIKSNMTNIRNFLKNNLSSLNYMTEKGKSYLKGLAGLIEANSGDWSTSTNTYKDPTIDFTNSNILYFSEDSNHRIKVDKTSTPVKITIQEKDSSDRWQNSKIKDSNNSEVDAVFSNGTEKELAQEDGYETKLKYTYDLTHNTVTETYSVQDNTDDKRKKLTINVLNNLYKNLISIMDKDKIGKDADNSEVSTQYTSYTDAKKALFEAIYGVNYDDTGTNANLKSFWDDTTDPTDISVLYDKIVNNGSVYNFSQDFYPIYASIVLDNVMNTYGEPKVTWIDTNNPNENGDAKYNWYVNLFNHMKDTGYQIILDGLASSPEWMQFAFESGIVTMEQLDKDQIWNPLIYTNCSDITETTDDVAIAKAEAEYKSAMNKIENKDKRYDLELKNIDTEHNSLQAEYESIKAAVDKNIERTFKLYS